ncbi:MAG: DUF6265 family protein [Phycisphaerae bacterium]
MKVFCIAVCSIIVAGAASFQADSRRGSVGADETAPRAATDLSWLAGTWQGAGITETWNAPQGGAILGMCRIGTDARRAIYELMLIEEVDGRLVLSLKHFKAQLKTMRDGVLQYTLIRGGPKEMVFENPDTQRHKRIVYRLDSGGDMIVRLEDDGPKARPAQEFRLQRLQ